MERWHHTRARRTRRFVSQALSLLLHPFLTAVFHSLCVFPPTAVCLSHSQVESRG